MKAIGGVRVPKQVRGLRSSVGPSSLQRWRGRGATTDQELVESVLETAWMCANLNASVVAQQPFKLFVVKKNRNQRTNFETKGLSKVQRAFLKSFKQMQKAFAFGELEEVTEHPILDLLEAPNPYPWLEGFTLIWFIQMAIETVGRSVTMIKNDIVTKRPNVLWPLSPAQVVPSQDNVTRELKGFRTRNEIGQKGPLMKLDDLLVFAIPSLNNPYVDVTSPMQSVAQSVGLLDLDMGLAWSMMLNRARPDAFISPKEGGMDEDEAERMMERFQKIWTNSGGDGGVLITESPVNVTTLGYNMRELDQLKRVTLHETRVFNAFDVPPAFATQQTNMANLQAAILKHLKYGILPRLVRIAVGLNRQLVNRFDESLIVWFDNPVPQDELNRAKVRQIQLETGERTINQFREEDGEPVVPWGDAPWLPKTKAQPNNDAKKNQRDESGGSKKESGTGRGIETAPRRPKEPQSGDTSKKETTNV